MISADRDRSIWDLLAVMRSDERSDHPDNIYGIRTYSMYIYILDIHGIVVYAHRYIIQHIYTTYVFPYIYNVILIHLDLISKLHMYVRIGYIYNYYIPSSYTTSYIQYWWVISAGKAKKANEIKANEDTTQTTADIIINNKI